MSDKFGEDLKFYKARNSGDGAASQFGLGSGKDCVFLEMTNQSGKDDNDNANFDWKNKICFKLGIADIGEILAVLAGIQNGVGPFDTTQDKHKGLYHSNKNGNAILYFGTDKGGRLRIYLSVKKDDVKTVVQHTISNGESLVLATLLRRAVEIMYNWH